MTSDQKGFGIMYMLPKQFRKPENEPGLHGGASILSPIEILLLLFHWPWFPTVFACSTEYYIEIIGKKSVISFLDVT